MKLLTIGYFVPRILAYFNMLFAAYFYHIPKSCNLLLQKILRLFQLLIYFDLNLLHAFSYLASKAAIMF